MYWSDESYLNTIVFIKSLQQHCHFRKNETLHSKETGCVCLISSSSQVQASSPLTLLPCLTHLLLMEALPRPFGPSHTPETFTPHLFTFSLGPLRTSFRLTPAMKAPSPKPLGYQAVPHFSPFLMERRGLS